MRVNLSKIWRLFLFSLFLSNNLNEAKKVQAVYLLNWNSVVFGPLLHYFHNMLHLISKQRKMCLNICFCYLRIRGVSQNLYDISQCLSKTIKIHQYTSKHTNWDRLFANFTCPLFLLWSSEKVQLRHLVSPPSIRGLDQVFRACRTPSPHNKTGPSCNSRLQLAAAVKKIRQMFPFSSKAPMQVEPRMFPINNNVNIIKIFVGIKNIFADDLKHFVTSRLFHLFH